MNHRLHFSPRYAIPLILIAALLGVFGILLLFQDQGPILAEIQPQTARPGEKIELNGQFLGSMDHGASVFIGGLRVDKASIVSWTSSKIVLVVPKNTSSGLVLVQTPAGRSQSLLFTNLDQVPDLVVDDPRDLEIALFEPESVLSYRGRALSVSARSPGLREQGFRLLVDGSPLSNPEIIAWTPARIEFVLPSWTEKGTLQLSSGSESGKPLSLILADTSALKATQDKSEYRVTISCELGDLELKSNPKWALVSAYLPKPQDTKFQASTLGKQDGDFTVIDNDEDICYLELRNPKKDVTYRFSMTWSVKSSGYQLNTVGTLGADYSKAQSIYDRYTVPSALVPSSSAAIKTWVKKFALAAIPSALDRARVLFKAVLDATTFAASTAIVYAPQVLTDRKANSFGIADLYVSALRAAGIPARIVEGILVDPSGTAAPHFWSEFFVPDLGWVPADPCLASMRGIDLQSPLFSTVFAGLDSNHILLIPDDELGGVTRFDENTLRLFQHFPLLREHAEASGNIDSFGFFISEPVVQRVRE